MSALSLLLPASLTEFGSKTRTKQPGKLRFAANVRKQLAMFNNPSLVSTLQPTFHRKTSDNGKRVVVFSFKLGHKKINLLPEGDDLTYVIAEDKFEAVALEVAQAAEAGAYDEEIEEAESGFGGNPAPKGKGK